MAKKLKDSQRFLFEMNVKHNCDYNYTTTLPNDCCDSKQGLAETNTRHEFPILLRVEQESVFKNTRNLRKKKLWL